MLDLPDDAPVIDEMDGIPGTGRRPDCFWVESKYTDLLGTSHACHEGGVEARWPEPSDHEAVANAKVAFLTRRWQSIGLADGISRLCEQRVEVGWVAQVLDADHGSTRGQADESETAKVIRGRAQTGRHDGDVCKGH